VRSDRNRVEHKPTTCIACGQMFVPKRADAVTCSNRCRQSRHRARRKPSGVATRVEWTATLYDLLTSYVNVCERRRE